MSAKNINAPLILMLCYSYVYDDPRVMPMAQSLVTLGYQVQTVGIALRGGLKERDSLNGIDILILPLIVQRGLFDLVRALWRCLLGDMREVGAIAASDRRTNKIASLFFNLWILRIGLRMRPKAIHCHTHSPLPAAWLLSRWHRVPLVYDSAESVPHILASLPANRVIRLITALEQSFMRRAEVVITVGERLAQSLRERGACRVVIIGNWKRLEDFAVKADTLQSMRNQLQIRTGSLVIAFIGNLSSTTYQLETLLEAVTTSPDVLLLIGGRGDMEAKIVSAAQSSSNIHWLGLVNRVDLPLYTELADAIYICLSPQLTQAYYVAPNKLFEAFAAGKAVIARRGVGEIGEILEKTGAGILLDEVTPSTLKDAFRQLQNPETLKTLQARAFAQRENYSWAVAEDRLKTLYAELISVEQPIPQ